MKSVRFYVLYVFPLLLYCILIYYLSSLSVVAGPLGTPLVSDKIKHGALYLGLSFLTFRAFNVTAFRRYAFVISALFAISYGALDEWHQYFVPGRAMDFWDWISDSVGALFVYAVKFVKRSG